MMKLFKYVAVLFSSFTICFSPVAEALAKSDQQKELVNKYLKDLGLTTKKQTVAEYWRQIRHTYPRPIQRKLDIWFANNREQMMPTVEATTFKDSEGREQVRLTFSRDGQSISAEIIGDEQNFMKMDGVMFSGQEMGNYEAIAEKMLAKDAKLKKILAASPKNDLLPKRLTLTPDEFNKFTVMQKTEYLMKLRSMIVAAQEVVREKRGQAALDIYNKKYEAVLNFIFGDEAEAKGKAASLTGQSCVVAGYISIYGEGQSCGGKDMGSTDLKQQIGQYQATCTSASEVPCNPLVYGFKTGTSAFCVSRTSPGSDIPNKPEIYDASTACNKKSPFNGDKDITNKKRIIESFLNRNGKKIDLKFDKDGLISPDQRTAIGEYLTGLNSLVGDATGLCGSPDFKKIKDKRTDQDRACIALLQRGMDLTAWPANPNPLPPPAPERSDCSGPGESPAADQTCACKAGFGPEKDKNGECPPILAGGDVNEGPVDKETKKNNWLLPVALLGVAAVAGFLLWRHFQGGGPKNPHYTPPAGTDPTSPTCDAGTSLVCGICKAPCGAGYTAVACGCNPIVIPDPPVLPVCSSENCNVTSGTDSTLGSGVIRNLLKKGSQ